MNDGGRSRLRHVRYSSRRFRNERTVAIAAGDLNLAVAARNSASVADAVVQSPGLVEVHGHAFASLQAVGEHAGGWSY